MNQQLTAPMNGRTPHASAWPLFADPCSGARYIIKYDVSGQKKLVSSRTVDFGHIVARCSDLKNNSQSTMNIMLYRLLFTMKLLRGASSDRQKQRHPF